MKIAWTIAFVSTLSISWAQLTHPKASPYSKVLQEVGLSTLTVEYSRPAMRGRTIFGDLVPYGRIWRVGANASTKFTVDTKVTVMDNVLPKGTYALYAFPNVDSWEVVFHTNTGHWGDGRTAYDPKEDAFRFEVVPESIPYPQENFLISFEDITHNTVNMLWTWENTRIRIPIQVDTHSIMLKEISDKLEKHPTAQTYYEAARYLQEQEMEYSRALGYVNKALELGGDTYYFYRVRSLIQAALNDYKGAIASAEKSMALANSEGKDEFVRMNQKNITLWKNHLKKDKK
ncbi:DUF2911 domain-containing protein [Spongiimicrobium sp. 2-473A-2-J]|uniref:DUF2911 domain-containing protein n=1 Tax=Eudoraea algarum TaxID=3417568 RepID=UPI003D36367F